MKLTRELKNNQSGFVHVPVLIAIVLLAALAATFWSPDSGVRSGQMMDKAHGNQISAQLSGIRQRILLCTVRHADTGDVYPIANGGSGGIEDVSGTKCDDGSASGKDLWSGTKSYFLPQPPDRWQDWEYYTDASASVVFLQIQAPETSRTLVTANGAVKRFSSSEAEIITTSDTDPYGVVDSGNLAVRLHIKK